MTKSREQRARGIARDASEDGSVSQVVFFGAPGAGKSTLARSLLGGDRSREAAGRLSDREGILRTPGGTCRLSWTSGYEDDPDRLVASALAADCAVLVIAPGASLPETGGHHLLLRLLNVPHVVLAVNRMDTVGFDQEAFDETVSGLHDPREQSGQAPLTAIPLSATDGDNVAAPSGRAAWYRGPTLLDCIAVAAAGRGEPERAPRGREVADQFETRLLWLSRKPMISGRQYRIEAGTGNALCTPERPKYRLDPRTLQHLAARTLSRNEVGVVNIALDAPVAFEPFAEGGRRGRFVLSDRTSRRVVAVGLIHFALRRSTNVRLQTLTVTPESRMALKGHAPCVVWFTGLSGAGKSTISNIVERALNQQGCHTILLDGDNVRHGLCRDLGFTEADRAENIRRIAEVAKLMTDAGLIALVSFISPFAAERQMARELIGPDKFLEIFVDTPLEVAEARDVKGLYKKARKGDIRNFTGIDSPYEPPESPSLRLRTASVPPQECASRVLELLRQRKIID